MRLWRMLALASVLGLVLAGGHPGTAGSQGLGDVRAGNDAFRRGDYAGAIESYTMAIRSGELVGEALAITYNNRGVAHGEAGDYDAAIADYSQALALRPADPTTTRNMRVAHVRRGEQRLQRSAYDAARADFDRAIQLEPDHPLAYQRRGELHAARGSIDEALADLETAARLGPDDPEILASLEQVRSLQTAATDADDDAEAKAAAAAAPVPEEVPAETAAADEVDVPSAEVPATASDDATAPPPAAAEAPSDDEVGQVFRATSAVNYRDGPSNNANRLGTIAEGERVTVTGETLGWLHVTLANGERGYIYGSWLEPVTE